MEFNVLNGRLLRREIKDSTQFTIVTEDRNVVTIPNFIETKQARYAELEKRNGGWQSIAVSSNIYYGGDVIPTFHIHNFHVNVVEDYCCDILTGRWYFSGDSCRTDTAIELRTLMDELKKIDRRVKIKELLIDVIVPKELRAIVCEYS